MKYLSNNTLSTSVANSIELDEDIIMNFQLLTWREKVVVCLKLLTFNSWPPNCPVIFFWIVVIIPMFCGHKIAFTILRS